MLLILCTSCGWRAEPALRAGEPRPAVSVFSILWRRSLVTDLPELNSDVLPTETSSAALDVERGRLFVGSSGGGLYCLRASDGHAFWRHDFGAAVSSRPLYQSSRDAVYVGTDDGAVYCLQGRSGRILWKADLKAEVVNAPAITEEALYVTAADGTVAALNNGTGQTIWTYRKAPPTGFTSFGHPGALLVENRLATGFATGDVVVFDPSDGAVIWERDLAEDVDVQGPTSGSAPLLDVDATPVAEGDTVYAASLSGGLYALDLASGSVRWRRSDVTQVTGLTLDNGMLYASRAAQGLLCLDAKTGATLWTRRVESGVLGQPVIHGDVVLVADSEGGLYAARQGDGEFLEQLRTGSGFFAPLTVFGNRGFILSNDGTLLALLIH